MLNLPRLYLIAVLVSIGQFTFSQNWDWVNKISGSGSDYTWDIVHDSQNNIIVTGRTKGGVTFGSGTSTLTVSPFDETDIFLAKFDEHGTLLWGKLMGAEHPDWGRSVTVDQDDNILFTGDFVNLAIFEGDTIFGYDNGSTNPSTQARSGFIAKYTPDGDLIWVKKFQGGDRVRGNGIATDSNGYTYLTGIIEGLTDFETLIIGEANNKVFGFIAKYDPDGNCIWANYFDSPYGTQGNDVQMIDDENIVCTGFYKYQLQYDGYTTSGVSATWGDFFMMRLDSAGNFEWNVKGTGLYFIEGFNMTVSDEEKDIYVLINFASTINFGDTTITSLGVGSTTSQINARSNGLLVKYDSLGNRQWIRHIAGKLRTAPEGIGLIDDKYVIISGYMEDTLYETHSGDTILPVPGYETGFVMAFDEAGTKQWHKLIVASGTPISASFNAIMGNTAYCIDVDENNNINVGGLFGDQANWDTTFVDAQGHTNDAFVARLYPPLDAALETGTASACIGDTTPFTSSAYGSPLTYAWLSPHNNIVYQDLDSMLLLGISNMQDTILFIASNGYVTDTAQFIFAFNSLPITDLGTDYAICELSDTLDAGGAGLWYNWGAGNVFEDSLLVIAASGIYPVSVMDAVTGCEAYDTIAVTMNVPPAAELGPDYQTCVTSDTLDAGGTGNLYDWGTGPVFEDSLLVIGISGTYTIVVTDALTGCTSYDTITVMLNTPLDIDLGSDYGTCQATDTLDAGGVGYWYDWGSGSILNDSLMVISASGTYAVHAIDALTGCESGDTIFVTFNTPLLVDLGVDYETCQLTDTLSAGNAPAWYDWGSGAVLNDSLLVINTPGTYIVLVTDLLNGCTSADTIQVIVDACAGLADADENSQLFLYPNPVIDVLFMSGLQVDQNSEVYFQLYDISGREVEKGVIMGPNYALSLGDLSSGQYTIVVSQQEQILTKQVIIKQ